MILWNIVNGRRLAKSAYQGGTMASVERDGDGWVVRWWVGPRGAFPAPSEAKAMAWVERFAASRITRLGRFAATPGLCPYDARRAGEPVLTAEDKARYDAFSATYDPTRAKKRRRKR
jgi:hypothetical protein